jgi:hypothetical protein
MDPRQAAGIDPRQAAGIDQRQHPALTDFTVRYVTLAYGGLPAIYRQSVMLLVSLAAHAPEPYEIVVATDRPDVYVWFGTRVEIAYLDASLLDAWRGPEPFSMRQKLALMRTAWPDTGAIGLLDADVLARSDLHLFVERLAAGDLFMHRREYALSASRRPGNRRLWRNLRGRRFGEWTIGTGTEMWNSGVLAARAEDRALFDGALELYDAIGRAGIRHFATEQLVESIVLSTTGRLREADSWFAHYWGNREGYDAEISRRLADAFIEGLSVKDAAARLRDTPIDLPVEVRPTRTQKLRRYFGR